MSIKGKYAMSLSVHLDRIEASVFNCGSGDAVLGFRGSILGGSVSIHIPLSVAMATADAFNKAMAEHEGEKA